MDRFASALPTGADKARAVLFAARTPAGPLDPLTRLAQLEQTVSDALGCLAEDDRTPAAHDWPLVVA